MPTWSMAIPRVSGVACMSGSVEGAADMDQTEYSAQEDEVSQTRTETRWTSGRNG